MSVLGGNVGGVLDFSATGCGRVAGVTLERKICEGFCGGSSFYRAVPVRAKDGDKLCAACVAKMARRGHGGKLGGPGIDDGERQKRHVI